MRLDVTGGERGGAAKTQLEVASGTGLVQPQPPSPRRAPEAAHTYRYFPLWKG
jgi:hypothetical protein